jgi:hypothetical protein
MILKGGPIFSPDSKHVAYLARKGGKAFAVIDGNEGNRFDGIGHGTLIFSPDSNHVAYGAVVGRKNVAVIDGKEGNQYDAMLKGGIKFRPDGSYQYLAVKGNRVFSVASQGLTKAD